MTLALNLAPETAVDQAVFSLQSVL